MQSPGPILAIDSASPTVSLAIAGSGSVLAEDHLELRRSAERMLASLEGLLASAGLRLRDLGGLVALQGPGSFTGLRVGLATVLGLHQASGIRAGTLPTLSVMAAAAGEPESTLRVAVDALRGDWYAATYRNDPWPTALDEAGLVSTEELLASQCPVATSGAISPEISGKSNLPHSVPPLAATAALLAHRREMTWEPAGLIQPIYFRSPAVTLA